MGGGGFLGLGPAPSAPAAPNYTQAAQATAQGNIDAARAALAGSLISQNTPYGNLSYNQSGTDQYGNPMYTATTSLSPNQQLLQQNKENTQLQLQSFAPNVTNQIGQNVSQPFNPTLPSVGINPGQSYQQAEMSILEPQLERQRGQLTNRLANQGIQPGSEAYSNALADQNNRENNLLANVTTQGIGVGLNANNQAFNQDITKYNLPINTLNALSTGSQVQNPNFTNTPTQAVTAGPNYSAAAANQYGAQMGNFNAQQAAQSNLNSGLFGLGGAGILALA